MTSLLADKVNDADLSSCLSALVLTEKEKLARMSLATGKQLPNDAGFFRMCTDIEDARYLLVSFTATLAGQGSMPSSLGFCLPQACAASDTVGLLYYAKEHVKILSAVNLTDIVAVDPSIASQPDKSMIAAILVVLMLLALVFAASCTFQAPGRGEAEASERNERSTPLTEAFSSIRTRRPTGPLLRALAVFTPQTSWSCLVQTSEYKPTDCLNGIRVLSMIWVVIGHTFLMPGAISGYSNPQDLVLSPLSSNAFERSPLLMFFISAQISVDTFFFLSGFLLSLLTLKELRTRKLNAAMAVLLRYVRLTPSLAFVLLVYYLIWPSLGYGPFSVTFKESIISRCQNSWWSELLYTMNFLPFDSNKVCMGWTWYLGNDMIFFIIAIAISPLYHRHRKAGWMALLSVMAVSLSVTAWLIVSHHLSVYVFDYHYAEYSYYAYSKPYNRAPAYFVGVATAWILDDLERKGVTRESRTRSCKTSIYATAAASSAVACLLCLVFIPATDFGDGKNSWSDFASVMYLDFGRMLWAMCWAVITLLCYYGYLPVIDGFLSLPLWTPLARLTYGVYLLHPLVIKLAAGTAMQYYTFSAQDMFYRSLTNTICSFIGSVLLWMLVERPIVTLTSSFSKRDRSRGEAKGSRAAVASA